VLFFGIVPPAGPARQSLFIGLCRPGSVLFLLPAQKEIEKNLKNR
jgi:hypothetical protein